MINLIFNNDISIEIDIEQLTYFKTILDCYVDCKDKSMTMKIPLSSDIFIILYEMTEIVDIDFNSFDEILTDILYLNYMNSDYLRQFVMFYETLADEEFNKLSFDKLCLIYDNISRADLKDFFSRINVNFHEKILNHIRINNLEHFFYLVNNDKLCHHFIDFILNSKSQYFSLINYSILDKINDNFNKIISMDMFNILPLFHQYLSIIKKFINILGFQINKRNSKGKTLLHVACQIPQCNIAVIEYLIRCGIDINVSDNDGNTALFYALANSNEIFSLFEKRFSISDPNINLNINHRNHFGETAVNYTCTQTMNKIILLPFTVFLIGNANPNISDHCGNLPLHNIFYKSKHRYYKYNTQTLINMGSNINAQNLSGETPLHVLCRNQLNPDGQYLLKNDELVDIIKIFLRNNVDINIQDKINGDTPFHIILLNYDSKSMNIPYQRLIKTIIDLMMEHHIKWNQSNFDGLTPKKLIKNLYVGKN